MLAQCIKTAKNHSTMPCRCSTWRLPNQLDAMQVQYIFFSMAQCHADATHEGSRISSMLCKYTYENFQTIAQCHANATWKIPNQLGVMPAQHMKVPKWARCHASATHEGSQMSSVPCQRNTWRLPNKLDAMSAQYMKAPERAQKLKNC